MSADPPLGGDSAESPHAFRITEIAIDSVTAFTTSFALPKL